MSICLMLEYLRFLFLPGPWLEPCFETGWIVIMQSYFYLKEWIFISSSFPQLLVGKREIEVYTYKCKKKTSDKRNQHTVVQAVQHYKIIINLSEAPKTWPSSPDSTVRKWRLCVFFCVFFCCLLAIQSRRTVLLLFGLTLSICGLQVFQMLRSL